MPRVAPVTRVTLSFMSDPLAMFLGFLRGGDTATMAELEHAGTGQPIASAASGQTAFYRNAHSMGLWAFLLIIDF